MTGAWVMAWALAGSQLSGAPSSGDVPMEVVYGDALAPSFKVDHSASQRTGPLDDRFWFSWPAEWSFMRGVPDDGLGRPVPEAGPCLSFKSTGSYRPRVRSPHSLALLRGQRMETDFTFEVEAMQTGVETAHRDLVLVFGFESPERFFYAHLGMVPDATSSNVFEVDGAPRRRIGEVGTKRIEWGRGGWRHLRVECVGKTARIFLDREEEPHFEEELTRQPTGLIGFGSFDDAGAFRNLRVMARPRAAGDGADAAEGRWHSSPFGSYVTCRRLSNRDTTALGDGDSKVPVRAWTVKAGRGTHEILLADVDGDGAFGSIGDRWAMDAKAEGLAVKEMLGLDKSVLTADALALRPQVNRDSNGARRLQVLLEIPTTE